MAHDSCTPLVRCAFWCHGYMVLTIDEKKLLLVSHYVDSSTETVESKCFASFFGRPGSAICFVASRICNFAVFNINFMVVDEHSSGTSREAIESRRAEDGRMHRTCK